eukprot:scaffold50664_cov31-Tisochrysis_lutea.AAC.1
MAWSFRAHPIGPSGCPPGYAQVSRLGAGSAPQARRRGRNTPPCAQSLDSNDIAPAAYSRLAASAPLPTIHLPAKVQ